MNTGQAGFIKPNLMASTVCEPTSAPTDSAFPQIHHGAFPVSNTSVKAALSRMTADDKRLEDYLVGNRIHDRLCNNGNSRIDPANDTASAKPPCCGSRGT